MFLSSLFLYDIFFLLFILTFGYKSKVKIFRGSCVRYIITNDKASIDDDDDFFYSIYLLVYTFIYTFSLVNRPFENWGTWG